MPGSKRKIKQGAMKEKVRLIKKVANFEWHHQGNNL